MVREDLADAASDEFDTMDTNHDGVIDREEWERANDEQNGVDNDEQEQNDAAYEPQSPENMDGARCPLNSWRNNMEEEQVVQESQPPAEESQEARASTCITFPC